MVINTPFSELIKPSHLEEFDAVPDEFNLENFITNKLITKIKLNSLVSKIYKLLSQKMFISQSSKMIYFAFKLSFN